jgi:uridine kinase
MWGDAMEQNNKLKLFIGYSHEDNRDDSPYLKEFVKHITLLKDNGLLSDIWYDCKIVPGEDLKDKIEIKLEDVDIVCLLISANFLSSEVCKDEKKKAFELRKKKGVSVVPIILSPCGWQDDKDIIQNHILALPTDGKPISSFPDRNAAWQDVYEGLKKVIDKENKIKQLKIKNKFENFLQDVEMLAEAHPQKERVLLDDIFIYPDLDKYDSLKKDKEMISLEELFKTILDYLRIVIVGEGQSGKTTICKMIFKELRNRNLVPVYISDTKTHFSGKIENKIIESLNEQYEGVEIREVYENYKDRIVPIIDDFHFAKNKEKHIKDLSIYHMNVLVVDDIFSLNIGEEKLISSFNYFKIKEFKPSLRYDLVKKWVGLRDREIRNDYKNIDKKTELINSILGKTLGKGIMPAYPFFVLSAVVTYETATIPLDQEITSQGYCYQAFIYFYLRKQGVESDDIGTYLNFLTEFAFYIYKSKKYELSPDEFNSFMQLYSDTFNLPIETDILLSNLSLIISRDSFNNYSFRYQYVYYFFVAKYLAENLEDNDIEKEIEKIIHSLHVDENAYIAVFIAHHSKDIKILDEIEFNALCLFDKYKSATLTKDEVSFFDEQADIIVEAALPSGNTTPEKERKEILKIEDEVEQSQEDVEKMNDSVKEDSLVKELRKAVKTVEVMGHIMKNRAGSLEKAKLEEIFRLAMNVHLRILSSFFDIIKDENDQKSVIDYISERLIKINEEEREQKKKQLSEEKMRKFARIIFWNLNFFTTYGIIGMIVRSLGSDKLTNISNKVCDEVNTPASFLVKHGILMWYAKNPQIGEISKKIKEPEFSLLADKVMYFMVANYCYLHQISYKDRQRIENELGIRTKQFLLADRKSYE